MQLSPLDVGKLISFEVYPRPIISSGFTAVKLLTMGSGTAYAKYNPKEMHENVYSSVPNCPQSYLQYIFYEIEFPNGKKTVVGDPWIVPDSVQREEGSRLVCVIPNAGVADIATVQRLLRAGNYEGVTVTQESV